MTADRIILRDFRNIESADIHLSPGVNVFLGNNAQGKTNLLEAIYLFAAGRSHRTSHERDMVRFGQPYFELALETSAYDRMSSSHNSTRVRTLGFKVWSESAKKRECRKNGVVVPLTELIGAFRAVLFCPEHLSIVKSGPSERRSFLDIALCQLRPVYLKSLARHNRILKQRNALLKQLAEGNGDRELLEVASDQLAREAAYIFVARRNYIRELDIEMKRFFSDLGEVTGESEQPSLVYHSSLGDDCELDESGAYKCYLERLTANTAREEAAGATLYASHKDDIIIRLDGRDARLYASQGQQRSLALSMKLGEGALSRRETGDEPVYLFDDVLSELDPRRQLFLLSKLRSQVIMTACTPPSAEANITANIINVFQGKTY